ncbi:MAG: hypothetical protein PVI23_01495 [Maricaulaceae bacterium]
MAVALLALQASWSVVALTADALGVPGARDWCPIVSDLLEFKAAAHKGSETASQAHDHNGHAVMTAMAHGPAVATDQAQPAANSHDADQGDDHHGGVHECPACMSKVAVMTAAPESEYALIRIAIAHAYATRQALAAHEGETGPPLGSRAPPLQLS